MCLQPPVFPIGSCACGPEGVVTKRPCMPVREKLVMQWIPSCKSDMSKHAGDDPNLASQSDCTLTYQNSHPPIPAIK